MNNNQIWRRKYALTSEIGDFIRGFMCNVWVSGDNSPGRDSLRYPGLHTQLPLGCQAGLNCLNLVYRYDGISKRYLQLSIYNGFNGFQVEAITCVSASS